jgi:hypothetical protein
VSLAAVVLLAAGCGGHGVRLGPPPSVPNPRVGRAPAAAAAQALAIAHSDRTVEHLLNAGGIAGVTGSPWLPGGVNLFVRLRRPVDVHGVVLPYAVVPPDAPSKGQCLHPYAPGWLRVDARAVTVLQILVDLHTGRVAEVDVDGSGRTGSAVHGLPHPSCEEIPPG